MQPDPEGFRLHLAQALALTNYFSLLALTVAWHAWLFPSRYFPTALVLTVTAVPLLLPIRGLLHGRPHSHIWAGLLAMLYFVHGVGVLFADPEQRWLGLAEVLFSLALVLSGTFYARWVWTSEP